MEGLGKDAKEIAEESDEIERQIAKVAQEKNIDLKSEKSGVFIIAKPEKENY